MAAPRFRLNQHPDPVWLLPLVSELEAIPPDADQLYARAAHAAASGDAAARGALFFAFQPRLDRSIRRCQRIWSSQPGAVEDACEASDIEQAAFPIFVDLLESWPGDGSISAHLLARFAWRLNDLTRVWRRQSPSRIPPVAAAERLEDSKELGVLIETVTARLHPDARRMLRWRVFERLTFDEIGERAGVSQRTVSRRFAEMADEARWSDLFSAEIGAR